MELPTDKINKSSNAYYTNKIHNNAEFYELEKKRVIEYQNNRYKNDAAFRDKKKEYCRIKMKELYNKRKNISVVGNSIN